MSVLEQIKDNSILIIPNNLKEKILLLKDLNNKLLNIKIMDLNEFKKNLYFDYSTQSICFIMEKYFVDYDNAIDILNNLYYVDNKKYGIDKLDYLVDIKNNLISNNLLIYNNLFKNYINNKMIFIYGYDYINDFDKRMFESFDFKIIEKDRKNYIHDVFKFESIDDEVRFVAHKICQLLDNDISIDKIKIVKPTSEYNTVFKRIFKLYNLPIYFDDNSLYSTQMGKDFINLLDADINITLNSLKEKYNMNNDTISKQFKQIINICNKYNWCLDFTKIKDALVEELKLCNLKQKKFKNHINLVSLEDNIFNDDDFVFLVGFNQGNYPRTYKDDDYINDNLKQLFGIENTTIKNDVSYNSLIKNIKSIKNLFISFKLKTPFNSYYMSPLIEDLNMTIIDNINYNDSYSSLDDKIKLATYLDNYFKYGVIEEKLDCLYKTYPDISYKTYSNKYKRIDKDLFKDYQKKHLLLSYSSINNFYHCNFRYYVENILKLQKYDNDFTLLIGNLFHYILSIMEKENFDFDMEYNNYIKNNYSTTTYSEKFFLNKLKKELEFIIEIITEQKEFTTFDKLLSEEVVNINFDNDDYNITFKGIIDKVMYKICDDKTLISIIDYKTGNPNLNLNNVIYGIDMQLCIYAYLCSKMKKFSNPVLVGIYLQKILNNEVNIEKNKSYIDLKRNNLKLQGYSTNNEVILKEFDKTYIDSKLIKGMKVSSNGFYKYCKLFDKEMLDSLLEIVDNNIKKAIAKILECDFEINPKKIDIKEVIGCKYCNYKDLCFMSDDDIVKLKEYKNLEFLKGDNDEVD